MADFETIECMQDGTVMEGFVVRPAGSDGPLPAVILYPGATGWVPTFRKTAQNLADLGYIAVGVDIYPKGADISSDDAVVAEMTAVLDAPQVFRARVVAWHDAVRELAGADPDRIAALGYCLGGKCVLELARTGADLKAVVSFHGLLTTDAPARPGAIKAEVVAWCAGKDPYAPLPDVDELRRELDAAGASHQVTVFSYAEHSFSNPDHDGLREGIAFHPLAHAVSWAGTVALLDHVLA